MAHMEDSSLEVIYWDKNPIILQLWCVASYLCCLEKKERSQAVVMTEKYTVLFSVSVEHGEWEAGK